MWEGIKSVGSMTIRGVAIGWGTKWLIMSILDKRWGELTLEQLQAIARKCNYNVFCNFSQVPLFKEISICTINSAAIGFITGVALEVFKNCKAAY